MAHASSPTIFWYIAVAFCSLGMWYCAFMLVRNDKVGNYRKKIINRISKKNREEISRNLDYNGWRYDEFERVSYYTMVFKFWKPLSSFYKDTKLEKEIYE